MAEAEWPNGFTPFGISASSRSVVAKPIASALTCAFSNRKHAGKLGMTSTAPLLLWGCTDLVGAMAWLVFDGFRSSHLSLALTQ
jgi:hypothetical protein